MTFALRLALALACALAAPGPARAVPGDGPLAPATRPEPRPARPPDDPAERACTADGTLCIARATYAADVCGAIEAAAREAALDPGFLARLLWRESLFDASAVSPAGAQGIAQFMPGTARLRALDDPFNPAEAIRAAAAYLREMERRYGNLGLAAAGYNAGEDRVERFMAGDGGLPAETRAYVEAITGHPAEDWRDGPAPRVDLALDPKLVFRDACLARAEGRGIPAFRQPLMAWGVVLAAQSTDGAARRLARRVVAENPSVLGAERIDTVTGRVPGMALRRHIAEIGRDTRASAEALCARLKASGGACLVRRN